MVSFKFDYEKCIGCKLCVKACFVDVIRWNEEEKKPEAKYPEECAVCTWCMLQCPKDAIDVIPDYTMPKPPIFPKTLYPNSYEEQRE